MWATSRQTTNGNNDRRGFTIVELLIVIVVIGILAAITVVAYNGVQAKAENTKTIAGVNQTSKLLRIYKEINGDYPPSPGFSQVCIGLRYLNDICSQNADGSLAVKISSDWHDMLATAGSLPQFSTKTLTRDAGRQVSGANFEYAASLIRYYLKGASAPCAAGGTGYNYADVTECRIFLP